MKGELGNVEQALDTWQLKASCRGPQAEVSSRPPTPNARTRNSSVRIGPNRSADRAWCVSECLDYAIRIHEPHGIWGGLNEMERKQLTDRRVG